MRCARCNGLVVPDVDPDFPDQMRCINCGERLKKKNEPKKGEREMTENTSNSKVCSKCKMPKSLTEFSINHSTTDGVERWCKKCKAKAQKDLRDRRHREEGTHKKPGRPKRPSLEEGVRASAIPALQIRVAAGALMCRNSHDGVGDILAALKIRALGIQMAIEEVESLEKNRVSG